MLRRREGIRAWQTCRTGCAAPSAPAAQFRRLTVRRGNELAELEAAFQSVQ